MNILMVYPKYPDTFWSFKHILDIISKKASFPPLGLLTIAAILPNNWEKKLIDVNITELKDEEIAWADMVFISAMIVQKDNAQEIIDRCKVQGKTVVAGGPVFTTGYQRFKGVDHFVLDEAEITLPLFLSDLENGKAKALYQSNKKPDITKTPVPLWSLIKPQNYATMPVQFSRGCPYNCEFCDIIIMNGRIPRTKTPKQMINEFQSIYEAGWRGPVFIVDDNFIGNKVKVKEMLKELIKWEKEHDYPFSLITEASLNLADDNKLLSLMRKANFKKVFLGIETPCIDSLNECGKNQNITRDLSESVRKINQSGIQVMGGFIVGFDHDPENIFKAQIDFIQENGIVMAMVGMLNVLPKTQLWYRLKQENRLLGNVTSGENTDGTINFIPMMGKEKLIEGYKEILSTIYSPKYYYKRIDTFINQYQPSDQDNIKTEGVKAFIKSSWKIGFLSRARFYYWKLLIKTLLTKRKAIPIAVECAIFGLHFDKITKKINNAKIKR